MTITNRFFKTAIILFITALAFTACTPDAGRDGVDGEAGPTGQNGNANVVSKTFTAAQITWADEIVSGTKYKTTNLNMPEITQAILDNGAVLIYGSFNLPNPVWTALPFSQYENGITRYFFYSIEPGMVKLRKSHSDNSVPTASSIPFRVVVIEGKVSGKMKIDGINTDSYDEIKSYFNLKEETVSIIK